MRPTLPRLVLGLALLAAPAAGAREVQPGDSLAEVKRAMGNPKGEVAQGEGMLLIYERGTVEIFQDYVVKVDLISHDELKAKEAAARQADMRRREDEAAALAERRRAGQEELDRTLTDEKFAEKSGAEQVNYWQDFMRRYPGIIVADHYAAAQSRFAEERAEAEARLEEERAAAAEPEKILSSRKKRKERRRVDPSQPVETPPYTAGYEKLGGSIADAY